MARVLENVARQQVDYIAQYLLIAKHRRRLVEPGSSHHTKRWVMAVRTDNGWFIPHKALERWCDSRGYYVAGVLATKGYQVQEIQDGYNILAA